MVCGLRGGILKKGQLEMQESIIVIFIVMILLLIGFVFFYRFTIADIQNQIDRHETNEFRQMINIIPNLAELKCSHLGNEDDCIDVMKLDGYSRLNVADFGDKRIAFKNMQTLEMWELYNEQPAKFDSILRVSSPVSLFYPVENKYYYGVLIVEWYK